MIAENAVSVDTTYRVDTFQDLFPLYAKVVWYAKQSWKISIIEYKPNILVTLELFSPLIHTVSLQDFCSFFRFFSLLADENRGFFM